MRCRADLHIHTERSPDSRMTLDEAAAAAKRAGVSALAVCDHDRPPEQAVFDRPLRDGVLLIPSVEYSTELGHLLGLFLERPTPEGRMSFSAAVRAIRAAGGLCVLAHPYEHRDPAEVSAAIAAHRAELDGLEIRNCRATKKRRDANALAQAEAERLSLLRTAGSDAHTQREIGGASVELEVAALTLPALRAALEQPLAFSCGKCRHLALARSQLTALRKRRAPFAAYCRWAMFAGLCVLRSVKGAFL